MINKAKNVMGTEKKFKNEYVIITIQRHSQKE